MSYYGIATAFTGPREQPSFHCTATKLNPDKLPEISEERQKTLEGKTWRQDYLVTEVDFDDLKDLSFVEKIKDEEDLKRTAKRFLDTVQESVRLQKQEEDSIKVPVIIGQDGRRVNRGLNAYGMNQMLRKFIDYERERISDLYEDCQFSYASYTHRNPGNKLEIFSDEQRSWVRYLAMIFKDKNHELNQDALKGLKALAIEAVDKVFCHPVRTSLRFMQFVKGLDSMETHPDLKFLKLDREIEREFIDSFRLKFLTMVPEDIRSNYADEMHHAFVKIDHEKAAPFSDVLKTILLDRNSEAQDGKARFGFKYDANFKAKIARYLARPSLT